MFSENKAEVNKKVNNREDNTLQAQIERNDTKSHHCPKIQQIRRKSKHFLPTNLITITSNQLDSLARTERPHHLEGSRALQIADTPKRSINLQIY